MTKKMSELAASYPTIFNFWNILLSLSVALNLVNFFALDVVYTSLFILGVTSLSKRNERFRDAFFLKKNVFNYFLILFLLSGTIGYFSSGIISQKQIEEILNLRWVLGFYAFYYAGKRLNETKTSVELKPLLVAIPFVFMLFSHWQASKGQIITLTERLQGYYSNPNHLGLSIQFLWAYFFGQLAIGQNSLKNLSLTTFVLFLITLASLATLSRSSWAGIGFAFLVALLYSRNRKFVFTVLSISTLMTLLLFANLFGLKDRLLNTLDFSSQSSQGLRIMAWKASWNIFLDHPIFGVGFEQNAKKFPEYYAKLDFDRSNVVGNCHNQYLEALSGAGLIGFLGYLGMLFTGFFFFHRYLRYSQSNEEKKTALSAILVIVALLGSSFTDTPFRLQEGRNFLMILLGFSFGYLHNSKQNQKMEIEVH